MYGVDQCRVCGTPILARSRRALELQEKANRRPPIPEEEWRRRGYLCAPTWRQLTSDPSHGCCGECGRKEMRKFHKIRFRLFAAVSVLALALGTALLLDSYMHH
jgi:hypothetical protein